MFAGNWLISELRSRIKTPSTQAEPPIDVISDTAIVSSHKMTTNNPPCIIEGVGEVRTSWIGQRGVCLLSGVIYSQLRMPIKQLFEMEQALAKERALSKLDAAKKELQVLAMECRKAFEAVGMEQSQHPQVRKALNLCSSYASPSNKPPNKCASSTVADLWRKDLGGELDNDGVAAQDKKQLATSVLGESMVQTLVQENRQPPDVSVLEIMHCTI